MENDKSIRAALEGALSRVGCGRVRALAALAVLVLCIMPAAFAQTVEQTAVINREYAIKAGFLYHFLTYVEWPAGSMPGEGKPFVIGIVQANPFGTALEKIAQSKEVAGHPIQVRLLQPTESLAGCHIVFVPLSVPAEHQAGVLKASQSSWVLLVGETDDFIERGGHVQFFVEGNKVRFAFSAELAKREDLKVSSKLLALAKIVSGR
jgi:hypothetical protein